MQLIATIEDPAVIQRILAHLGLPGAREDPQPPLPLTAAGGPSTQHFAAWLSRRCRRFRLSRTSALLVRDGLRGERPLVIQGPDLTAEPGSGRIGARSEEAYPHCDKDEV
jgi:hypothetical protein